MTSAIDLLIAARGHNIAAKALSDLEGENAFNGPMSASIYLLIGNATELALKAIYLALGGDETKLERSIGHRLRVAYAAVTKLGFHPSNPNIPHLVDAMHDAHAKHTFRYLGDASIEIPSPSPAIEALDALVMQAFAIVCPADQAGYIQQFSK